MNSLWHPLNHLHIFDVLATVLFGSKAEEVTGEWRKLYNERLHHLYSSANTVIKSRKTRSVKHVAYVGEMRSVLNILVGEHEGKMTLGRYNLRWERIALKWACT
jgi:hypothetical protein